MFKANRTSYLRKLENFTSGRNIKLTGTKADREVQSIRKYEKNEFDEKSLDRDIVSMAEEVFGVKARPPSSVERKLHAQVADKALVYQIINGEPKILVYK